MKPKRILLVLSAALLLALTCTATASAFSMGLWQSSFKKIASDGQGDWKNIYAWSMASFKGDLYVGTARQAAIAPIMEYMTTAMPGFQMPAGAFPSDSAPFIRQFMTKVAGSPFPMITNNDKFEAWNAASCAEIWCLRNGAWMKVYTAPRVPAAVLDTNGKQSFAPAMTATYDPNAMSYTTPECIGFRSMVPFTDAAGKEALYASAGSFSFGRPLNAAQNNNLLLRSLDGVTWTKVVTPAAMGRETRAMGVHHGKLYLGIGTATNNVLGGTSADPSVWCSSTPDVPASWTKVLDYKTSSDTGNTGVISLTSANGWIYVGTENSSGYQVWRSTVADPAGNADWKCVVKDGAGDQFNAWAGTMKEFRGNVYVGSMAVPGVTSTFAMKGFDLIRIKPNDSWQLLVGNRTPEVPVNGSTAKRWPLTGLPSGFGMPTNLYCWNMEVYNGYLYVGSMDMSSMLRAATEAGMTLPDMGDMPPQIMQLVVKAAGFDLWKSPDGMVWLPVTLTGLGDWRNYGARTIRVHNNKLYIGTADPFKGFQVWVGN